MFLRGAVAALLVFTFSTWRYGARPAARALRWPSPCRCWRACSASKATSAQPADPIGDGGVGAVRELDRMDVDRSAGTVSDSFSFSIRVVRGGHAAMVALGMAANVPLSSRCRAACRGRVRFAARGCMLRQCSAFPPRLCDRAWHSRRPGRTASCCTSLGWRWASASMPPGARDRIDCAWPSDRQAVARASRRGHRFRHAGAGDSGGAALPRRGAFGMADPSAPTPVPEPAPKRSAAKGGRCRAHRESQKALARLEQAMTGSASISVRALTLAALAELLGLGESALRAVINQQLGYHLQRFSAPLSGAEAAARLAHEDLPI